MVTIIVVALLIGALLAPGTCLHAEDFYLGSPFNYATLRFEIDNDWVWGEDSHFTNAWSFQYHTAGYAHWDDTCEPALVKWIGNHFPTLAGADSMVRNSHGIGQNMYTPADLSLAETPDGELPYAGTLTYSMSWQRFNRRVGRNLQMTVGVLGKESLAGGLQRATHDVLNEREVPKGWDSQRHTEPLFNIGYQYMHSLVDLGTSTDGWGGQLTIEPSAAVGNLATGVELGLGVRFGWNMSEGFGTLPAPPGIGFLRAAQIPKSGSTSPQSIEMFLGIRGSALAYSVIYDGSLITGDDRDVDREIFTATGIVGVSYHLRPSFSIAAYLQRSTDLLKPESLPENASGLHTNADVSYGALMIDLHF